LKTLLQPIQKRERHSVVKVFFYLSAFSEVPILHLIDTALRATCWRLAAILAGVKEVAKLYA
jgi:hypothetical protein